MNVTTASRVNVLGVGISVLNLGTAVGAMAAAVRNRTRGYICVTGVHGVMEAQEDESFRSILNGAFLNTPDGMPMVWLGNLDGHPEMSRVYGPDLMLEVFGSGELAGATHFFYGGASGVPEALKQRMQARFPGLKVCGCYSPPFRPLDAGEEAALVGIFEKLQPDITWIGLSTPKQEKFMAAFLPKLKTTLMVGVGAAFDFHAGRVRQAPRWVQRSGFEWLYRLSSEPRRLWKRYLKNNPLFVLGILGQYLGLRRHSIGDQT